MALLIGGLYGFIGGIIFSEVLGKAVMSNGRESGIAFIQFVVLSQTWPISMWFYRN